MNNAYKYKQLFSKKNLYFVASFVVLIAATIMLLLLLKNQSADNLQAKIFSEASKELSVEVVQKEKVLEENKTEIMTLPSTDMVIDPQEDISEVTRYLDEVFASFPGEFVNTSLTFSELRESDGLSYTEANLSITSSRDNFFNFLEFVENTGFSGAQSRLMEIRSINISLNNANDQDKLTYRVVIRIYFQSQTEEVVDEEVNDASNPFSGFF